MPKKYISIDVETTGSVAPLYSMISLGACVIGEYDKTFYAELRPLDLSFEEEACKVSLKRIECLRDFVCPADKKEDWIFLSLMHINNHAKSPLQVMEEFSNWLKSVTGKDDELVEVSMPIKFDGGFTNYYFHRFLKQNPFGHSGLDIQSFYRGRMNNLGAKLKEFMPDLPHHALEDAIIQAKAIEPYLLEAQPK